LIAVGERAPDATVWLAPRETAALSELLRESAVLLLFYLFDWSST
jgi:peroxiredoxin